MTEETEPNNEADATGSVRVHARVGRWIRCADQMPPEGKERDISVLVWDGYTVRECEYFWSMLMHRFGWRCGHPMPTHWMPLPDPPAE